MFKKALRPTISFMRFILTFILMSTVAAISSCNSGSPSLHIDWNQNIILPDVNGKPSFGYAGPVAGTIDDKIIVAGGANFPDSMPWLGGKKKYYDDVFVYVKKDSGLHLQYQSKLPDTIAYPAVCSAPDGIVYAGGENQHGFSNEVWMIKIKDRDSLEFVVLPALPNATANGSLALYNNHLYVAGGETAEGVSAKLYALNLAQRESGWKALADLPKPVSHGLLIEQSGKLFLIGGRMKTKTGISDLYASVYAYDISSNQWEEKQPLPYALSAGTGIAYNANEILLFGGDKGETFHKTEELIAAIANEKDTAKKEELIQQKNTVQSTHPGFSREILLYDTNKNEWAVVGALPFETPVTTTAFATGDTVFIPSGEIKAGVRSPKILMGRIR